MKRRDMTEKVEKELSEIETLTQIKSHIQDEISKLQVILSNLQAQEHSNKIKDAQDAGMADNEKMNKYAAEERRLEVKRIEVEKRIDIAEICELKLNDREKEIEKREQKMLELEVLINNLNKQRANFELYKTSINKELDAAKITIAEANAVFEKIEMEKQMLVGREKKVKEMERWWNDRKGELDIEIKAFEIEKENFLGLATVKKDGG